MGPLFLTGASGFVGRHLAARLVSADLTVRYLTRDSSPAPAGPGWTPVIGDLSDPAAWRAALEGVDTVVHLAALTGKGRRAAHDAVNFQATAALVREAEAAGVRRFLFVSSIAAGYRDRRRYHYAEAKARAEAAVQASAMATLIVRPTMVLGPGSAVAANLRRLATLPVPIMFGRDRPVQPIHVDDLADAIAAALDAAAWPVPLVELGGPEVLPMSELLSRLRVQVGRPARRPVSIPLAPIRALVGLVEPVLLPVLPFTAGQLAAFANDSIARPPHPAAGVPSPRRGIDAMLATDRTAPAADPRPAAAECRSLCRYLAGRAPSSYVVACYHRSLPGAEPPAAERRPIDRLLLGAARLSPLTARPADAYARLARPTGPLRRRITLLLAILENAPDLHERFDTAKTGSALRVWLELVAGLAAGGLATAIGLVAFAPLHLMTAPFGGRRPPAVAP